MHGVALKTARHSCARTTPVYKRSPDSALLLRKRRGPRDYKLFTQTPTVNINLCAVCKHKLENSVKHAVVFYGKVLRLSPDHARLWIPRYQPRMEALQPDGSSIYKPTGEAHHAQSTAMVENR